MKILWVKTDFLHPTLHGGRIRTLETVKRLHARHEIHYAAYADPEAPEGPARAGEYSTRHYPVEHRVPLRGSAAFAGQAIQNLFSPMPLAVSRYATPLMSQQLRQLLDGERFDSVVCDFPFPAPNFPSLRNVVMFAHNVEAMIWERMAEKDSGNLVKRAYWNLQARRMRQFEGQVCRDAGLVIAVSESDAHQMKKRYGDVNVQWTPTGVDLDYFAKRESPPTADIVFVGSMDWMPNQDGARFFMDEIFPLILKRRPQTTVSFVGRRAPGWLEQMASDKVLVTGTVPDVRPYLWGARISIVPLRVGGGTRLKIFEAMAAGVPVVSTRVGAEGLDVRAPEEIRLADAPEDFARACLQLLESEGQRSGVEQAARRLVEDRFSWDRVAAHFEHLLETGPRP